MLQVASNQNVGKTWKTIDVLIFFYKSDVQQHTNACSSYLQISGH